MTDHTDIAATAAEEVRQRARDILSNPHARTFQTLAHRLAFDTELSPDAAQALLDAAADDALTLLESANHE